MTILKSADLAFAKHLQAIARVNPFLPARIELERKGLVLSTIVIVRFHP
ncbi:MAG: hypothetical protein GY762_18360 [Proteobacteria bacterium]|nr:hypothetical protein [Pseudomonadota bacterium]